MHSSNFSKISLMSRQTIFDDFFSLDTNEKILFFQRPFRTFQHRARLSLSFSKKKIKKKSFFSRAKDPMTLLVRRKISISNKRKKKTEITKEKIKKSLTGRRFSQQHLIKLKKKSMGKNNPNFGRKRSTQTKRRISLTLIRKKHSKEASF